MTGGMRGGGACANPKRLLVTGASFEVLRGSVGLQRRFYANSEDERGRVQ